MKVLLQAESIDVNKADNFGATPLKTACVNNCVEIVNVLLQAEEIDVNQADLEGNTPLIFACRRERWELVKVLLRAGARVSLQFYNEFKTILQPLLTRRQAQSLGEQAALRFGTFETRMVPRVVPKSDATCSICFENLITDNDDWVLRRCGHAFHRKCLAEWSKRKSECPICRGEGVMNYEEDKVYTLRDTLQCLRF